MSLTFLSSRRCLILRIRSHHPLPCVSDHLRNLPPTCFPTQSAPETITTTWSMDSNLSDLSQSSRQSAVRPFKLFCWVVKSDNPFSVKIGKSQTVDDLKQAIKMKKEHAFAGIDYDTLDIWKLSPPIPSPELGVRLGHVQSPKEITGSIKLDPCYQLSEYFSSPPPKHIHIVVLIPSRKHPRSGDDDHEAQRKRTVLQRTWNVSGAIHENEANRRYYLDPGTQEESERCLEAVSQREFLLLTGARASGKSTRLLWLQQKLEVEGYRALYVTFESVLYKQGTKEFWRSFGTAVANAVHRPKSPTTPVSSLSDFLQYFHLESWGERNVVLLIDEFSCLYDAAPDVRDDCLQALRALKNSHKTHALQCLIAAGTFGIVYLNPSPTSGISPFNVASVVQNPYFSIDETKKLFHQFAEDLDYLIDEDIIEDIWAKSNGHPGMVCLCGRTIYRNLQILLDVLAGTISYKLWQQFPIEDLYGEIAAQNTFYLMIQSLSHPKAYNSLILLRSRFVGFLDEVELKDQTEEKLADFLTSEGVLLKPKPAKTRYRMASPLGFSGVLLIPLVFRNAPSSAFPLQNDGITIHVLDTLIESLKFFDKTLIRDAFSRSYKTPKVIIRGTPSGHVPRESVYDTELMRILSNWLQARHGWTVTGQCHLQDDSKKHKYCDIVIKKEDQPIIVFELLATGEPSSVKSHIQKTPAYKVLLAAEEAWVVHFTCQKDYCPIWQSDLDDVNVVHFAHDFEFTRVLVNARWKDYNGEDQEIVNRLIEL
ncbi:hypothetical protein JOM56_000800 [Amanita muscaria]